MTRASSHAPRSPHEHRDSRPPSIAPVGAHPTQKRAALLVEGGGLRGAFSAGVLAELSRPESAPHVPIFDDIVAVSAGAPTAAYMVSGQVEMSVRIWSDHTSGNNLVSPWNLLKGVPLMDIERLVRVIDKNLDTKAFAASTTRLWFVVTNCHTGLPEYKRVTVENINRLSQATMALPIAYGKVVNIKGVPYIDGGVADSVPAHHVVGFGHDFTVAVLTQPREYRSQASRATTALISRAYASYPNIGETYGRRWQTANRSLALLEALEDQGKIHVIRPTTRLAAGRLSTGREDIVATIDAGRAAARTWIRKMRTNANTPHHSTYQVAS